MNLPIELLLDQVLPHTDYSTNLALAITSKQLHVDARTHVHQKIGETLTFFTAKNPHQVKILIAQDSDVSIVDKHGCTPLFYINCPVMAQLMINAGMSVTHVCQYGATALHINENAAVAQLLIDADADVNIQDEDGLTPLHLSTGECLKLLIDVGADMDIQDLDGTRALDFADTMEDARRLFDAGAELGPNTFLSGETSEHYEYLASIGANVHALSRNGSTALHARTLAIVPKIDVIQTLLKLGVGINVVNNRDRTALWYSKTAKLTSALLEAGARVDLGESPLFNLKHVDQIQPLINAGADVNGVDWRGRTPLHMTRKKMIWLALRMCGADIDALDDNGDKPDVLVPDDEIAALKLLLFKDNDIF